MTAGPADYVPKNRANTKDRIILCHDMFMRPISSNDKSMRSRYCKVDLFALGETMAIGFSDNTFAFLRGLKAENTKDWFEAHRASFDADVKIPAFDVIDALAPRMSALDPPLKCEARVNGSLKRINRDVRFSKDKSPYNPRIHMVFWSGSHPNRSPAMHVVIGPDGIGYGAGHFGVEAGTLEKYRTAIMEPKSREQLLAAVERAKAIGCEMGDPALKTMPRGYATDAPWSYLLRYKAFVARTHENVPLPGWVNGPNLVDEIMNLTDACQPFISWLHRHA